MKQLIVVFGFGANNSAHNAYVLGLIYNDLSSEERKNIHVEYLVNDSPESALKTIIDYSTLSFLKDKAKEDIVVAYSGENLYLFKYRLPYENFDILELRKKIDQAVSDDDCHQKTEMVNELFIGGILRFLKVK